MTRPRPLRSALLTLLVLVAACGLTENDEPQAIPPENLPPDLIDPSAGSSTSTTEIPTPGSPQVLVYFLTTSGDREQLQAVERVVDLPVDPAGRISALLSQPPTEEEGAQGLTTSIPADTLLIGVTPAADDAANEVVVELSGELLSIQGEELAKAFAQIVWTVTDQSGVREVRFVVDGVERRAPDDEGVEQDGAVTRADYTALSPER